MCIYNESIDIHNMVIHNWKKDIHNWNINFHNWILDAHNWIMDTHNWIIKSPDIPGVGDFMFLHRFVCAAAATTAAADHRHLFTR